MLFSQLSDAVERHKENERGLSRGGATVLKVGGTISRAKRAKKIFDPPTLRLAGGYKNDYGCTKFAYRNGIMILKKSEKFF